MILKVCSFIIWTLLIGSVRGIFDDELNKIDWFSPRIGSFIESPILTGSTIVGVTDLSLLVGISTKDGSVSWRKQIHPVLKTTAFDIYLVVPISQNNISYLNFYDTQSGEIVESSIAQQPVINIFNLDDEKLFISYQDGSLSYYNRKLVENTLGRTQLDQLDQVSILENGRVVVSNGRELEIFEGLNSWKSLTKLRVPALKLVGNKYLSSKDNHVYEIDSEFKTHKISLPGTVKDINSHGGVITDGKSTKFRSYHTNGEEDDSIALQQVFQLEKDAVYSFANETLTLVDLETGISLEEIPFPTGLLTNCNRYSVKEGNVFVEYSNSSMVYFPNNGGSSWTRDEVLAHVRDWVLISLQEPETAKNLQLEQQTSTVWQLYVKRLRRNIAKLVHLFHAQQEQEENPFGDIERFGFNKRLLLLTETSNLVAIDVERRTKLWEVSVSGKSENFSSIVSDSEGRAFIVSAESIVEVNVENGEFLQEVKVDSDVELFNIDGGLYLHELGTGNIVSLSGSSSQVLYTISNSESSVFGLRSDDGKFTKTWSLPLQPEQLLSIERRIDPNNDIVGSVGVVLGDRSVLYKYLQPNLALISTWNLEIETLTLRLVNIITGEMVLLVEHTLDEFILPETFQLVFEENFIVYKYVSYLPTFEQKIVVIDMFESDTPNVRESLLEANKNKTLVPHVVSKSFNFPQTIDQMTVTKTKFGISIKNVVLLLENGQVVLIPKIILNARRPEDALTSTERGEFMNLQYLPNIVYSDKDAVISNIHTLQISQSSGKNKIQSVATKLESTSIVCVITPDCYCLKLYPSGNFDTLGHGFDRFKLSLTIVGLVVSILVVRPIVKRRKLNSTWVVA